METIVGIIVGLVIGIGCTIAAFQRRCAKGKCKSNEWVNWRPVDERMEVKEVRTKKPTQGIKGRTTHNKISEDTDKPKTKRAPRKNTGKRKYYKNKKKKVTPTA
tara:strand:+ start:339 stop:650 length:312 start_codon:yes stop_codon:yes gene_type:complete